MERKRTKPNIRYFPVQALNFAFKDKFQAKLNKFDKNTEKWLFFLSNLASGGAAGACTLIIVYPLDFAHTRLAIDTINADGGRGFTGLRDCIVKVYTTDGIRGIYRGFVISIIGIIRYR